MEFFITFGSLSNDLESWGRDRDQEESIKAGVHFQFVACLTQESWGKKKQLKPSGLITISDL